MQFPHGVLCVDDFFIVFCTVLTDFVDRTIEDILSVIAIHVCVAHNEHFGSSCLNLHSKQFPYQVCVTEGMYHAELDVSLIHICGEVTSIG